MKNKITGFVLALFAMLAFANAKAQCAINNLMNCTITIKVTEYNTTCTAICSGATTIVVPPGPMGICSGLCTSSCKLVEVVAVAGVLVPSVFVSSVTGPTTPTGNMPNMCCATSAFYDNVNGVFIVQ